MIKYCNVFNEREGMKFEHFWGKIKEIKKRKRIFY